MCQQEIITVLALAGLLAIAQQPARLANLATGNVAFNINLSQQNTVSQLQRLGALQLAVTARTVRSLTASPFRSRRPHSAGARGQNSARVGIPPARTATRNP